MLIDANRLDEDLLNMTLNLAETNFLPGSGDSLQRLEELNLRR